MASKKKKIINSSGKRKSAIARATVYKGTGKLRINKIPIEIYNHPIAKLKIMEPIALADSKAKKINIDVSVNGGGVMGQADAIRTAIAKGLVDYYEDESLKKLFLDYDRTLLVNDPRRKEPKHPLGRGARKKRQKSYR